MSQKRETREQLLDTLRRKVRAPIEKRADEIWEAFGDDQEGLTRFQLARADLDALIARLEHEKLRDLSRRLADLSEELRTGIGEMDRALKRFKDFVSGARLFTTVVGIVARIVALA